MSKSAVYVTHVDRPPCLIHKVMKEKGYAIQEIYSPNNIDFLRAAAADEALANAADIWYFGGGPMGAYETDKYEFIRLEIEIMRTRLKNNRTNIGICLGAQMMAAALDSKVYKGSQGLEVGWKPLESTAAQSKKEKTPLRHLFNDKAKFFFFHNDTFDLPKGVELLASTNQYPNQIFTYGKSIAIQAHPEIYPEQKADLSRIISGYISRGEAGDMTVEKFETEFDEHVDLSNRQFEKFAREYLSLVAA